MMTNEAKERFCLLAATLLSPPDDATADDLRQDGIDELIAAYARELGAEKAPRTGFVCEAGKADPVAAQRAEYARLFGEYEEKISLVESTYKPWTIDKQCGMVFAASKGLLMGDHALHMAELYRLASIEVPEAFRGMPDHLVLELEFLALMYRSAADEEIERFIGDHLDWIPDLKKALEKARPHPFYGDAVELLHLFLQNETNKEKAKDHEQKKIH